MRPRDVVLPLLSLFPGLCLAPVSPVQGAADQAVAAVPVASTVASTWERAEVALPASVTGALPVLGLWLEPAVQQAVRSIDESVQAPAVVFLHGCNGIGREEESAKLILLESGVAAFFPDSFARRGRAANCLPERHATALFPQAHPFRQQEIAYALAQVHKLPWVDQNRVFLMGFSEGAMAVAYFNGSGIAGQVILGWHCQGHPPYVGLRTAVTVPVLAIIGADDPWYAGRHGRHCGEVFEPERPARSLVLPGNGHAVLNSPIVANADLARKAILDFLRAH